VPANFIDKLFGTLDLIQIARAGGKVLDPDAEASTSFQG
jgi:hypothetical protein